MTKLVRCHVLEGTRPGPRLLITAGVHGDEFEPIVAVWRLVSAPRSAEISGRVTLIPVANPAAFARATRTAEDGSRPGTHVSRPSRWQHHPADCRRVLTEHIHQADYYVDLHTGGTRYRLLPLAGYSLHSDSTILDKQRTMAQAFQLPIVWGTSAELQGRSLSEARDTGVPAIYAEHGGGGTFEPKAVEDYMHGCHNLMVMLGMLDGPVDQSRVPWRVEDPDLTRDTCRYAIQRRMTVCSCRMFRWVRESSVAPFLARSSTYLKTSKCRSMPRMLAW